jgi:hypothetical protein
MRNGMIVLVLCGCAECDCQYAQGDCTLCDAANHVQFEGEIHWIKREVR